MAIPSDAFIIRRYAELTRFRPGAKGPEQLSNEARHLANLRKPSFPFDSKKTILGIFAKPLNEGGWFFINFGAAREALKDLELTTLPPEFAPLIQSARQQIDAQEREFSALPGGEAPSTPRPPVLPRPEPLPETAPWEPAPALPPSRPFEPSRSSDPVFVAPVEIVDYIHEPIKALSILLDTAEWDKAIEALESMTVRLSRMSIIKPLVDDLTTAVLRLITLVKEARKERDDAIEIAVNSVVLLRESYDINEKGVKAIAGLITHAAKLRDSLKASDPRRTDIDEAIKELDTQKQSMENEIAEDKKEKTVAQNLAERIRTGELSLARALEMELDVLNTNLGRVDRRITGLTEALESFGKPIDVQSAIEAKERELQQLGLERDHLEREETRLEGIARREINDIKRQIDGLRRFIGNPDATMVYTYSAEEAAEIATFDSAITNARAEKNGTKAKRFEEVRRGLIERAQTRIHLETVAASEAELAELSSKLPALELQYWKDRAKYEASTSRHHQLASVIIPQETKALGELRQSKINLERDIALTERSKEKAELEKTGIESTLVSEQEILARMFRAYMPAEAPTRVD